MKHAAQFNKVCKDLSWHVAVTYTYGGPQMSKAVKELTAHMITLPADPPSPAMEIVLYKWRISFKEKAEETKNWEESNKKTFSLLLQHSNPDITAKVESMAGRTTVKMAQDGIGLLKLLRGATYQHGEPKQGTMAIVESDKRAYIFFNEPIKPTQTTSLSSNQ